MEPIKNYVDTMWELAANGQLQGVWFWAAVYAFLMCSYSFILQLRTRQWPNTRGDLAELGLGLWSPDNNVSERDYKAKALYSYQVDGKHYQGKRVSPWIIIASHNARFVLKRQLSKVQTLPGGKVKVFYKPSNPAKCWLILPSLFGVWFTAVASVALAIGYWFRFYA